LSRQIQHYITRGLTEPWEYDQRRLYYFDFAENQIDFKSSKSLFSGRKLWSELLEPIFNKLFESSLASNREAIIKGDGDVQLPMKTIYAIFCQFIIHMKRCSYVKVEANDLEKDVFRFEQRYPEFIHYMMTKWDMVRIPSPNFYLCFPESVIYPIPIDYGNELKFGYAMSITPHWAVAMIQKGWNLEMLKRLATIQLSGLSVGLGPYANKVIFSAELLNHKTKEEIIAQTKTSRAANAEYVKLVLSKNRFFQDVWKQIINNLYERRP
jgi:hypothetical protein